MTISLLHHKPKAVELPCAISCCSRRHAASTRNMSMGGVWLQLKDKPLEHEKSDWLGEFHIELDGYSIDIPSHFTRIFEREYLVEFLTLTIEQKVILGFIINRRQSCSVGGKL